MRVLMIEDDREIVEAVTLAFQIRWPEAGLLTAHLGRNGVALAESEGPDIIILDLGLPDMSGFDVLREIRRFSDVPVLVLTVRSDEADIVRGLDGGADDYMVKPFKQLELLARAKALTRRSVPEERKTLVCGPLHLDLSSSKVVCGDKEATLTLTESRILCQLMRNAGHAVTHSTLAEALWGEDYDGAADSLKVHIRRLRQKLETDASRPQFLLAKTGVGYLLTRPN